MVRKCFKKGRDKSSKIIKENVCRRKDGKRNIEEDVVGLHREWYEESQYKCKGDRVR